MADYHTRYKIHPQSYEAVLPKTVPNLRDLYRKAATKYLSSCAGGAIWGHDCRRPVEQNYQTDHDWDAFIMCHALQSTYDDQTRQTSRSNPDDSKAKLIFHIGNTLESKTGSGRCDFNYPRGIAISFSGDILIADSMNNRLQVFNSFGTFRGIIGKKGSNEGNFNNPTDVAVMPNDDIIVADYGNKRIQVFRMRRYVFIYKFPTYELPFSVTSDNYSNIIVGTRQRTVEIYRKTGRLVNRFHVHQNARLQGGPVYLSINPIMDEIVVSDPTDRQVKTYNYSGDMLQCFTPETDVDSLAVVPGGIFIDSIGQICICDTLNRTVNLYSEQGKFIKLLLSAGDGIGSVQNCAIGPEGHLIITQYSTEGYHSVKIMRYQSCSCHKNRPSSAKRPQTPIYA